MQSSDSEIKVRTQLVGSFILLLFLALVVRMYYLQVYRHDELFTKAQKQYTATVKTSGKRGEIFDYSGSMLVGNAPCVDIQADPSIIGNALRCQKISIAFAKLLKTSPDKLYRKLMNKERQKKLKDGSTTIVARRYAPIARMVSLDVAKQLKKIVKVNHIQGITFINTYKRVYPKDQMLANILGFTNRHDDKLTAVFGIEKYLNREISSSSSKSTYERSRDGKLLPYGHRGLERHKDGFDVYLTIKEPIQAMVEGALDKLVAKWHPKSACVIMANPATGDILAIAQRPTFNPNDRRTINPQAWRNRLAEDTFEPGSTMKPMVVAGALDYGIVTPNTKFDCEKGSWYYGGATLHDSHPPETKFLTVSEIVKVSSNIGTAKISLKMGERRLNMVLRKFGFGNKTGIQFKSETRGIFRPLAKWDKLSVTRFPIGQGIAVSPLQLLRAYCALADHGRLRKLRLIDRMEHPELGVAITIPKIKPVKLYRRADTDRKIIAMMKKVTQRGGTARKAAIDGYYVAGKTGTSQKWINTHYDKKSGERIRGHYSHKKYFATFIGFVPADRPAFVLMVTVDEPQGSIYGGTVAAPTFKNIAEQTLRYLNIEPDYQIQEQTK
jgi:cell division protein FtsI/penicillin-binding protein 2